MKSPVQYLPMLPRPFPLLCIALLGLALSACSLPSEGTTAETSSGSVVRFVGISVGTLLTPPEELDFRDRFAATDRDLVGVVELAPSPQRREVRALWYAPDERMPLLGSTTVLVEPDAFLTRLSLSNPNDWKPTSVLLRVSVHPAGKQVVLGTGSLRFFCGMEEGEITQYLEEERAWRLRAAEGEESLPLTGAAELELLDLAKEYLRATAPLLAMRHDINGDALQEYLFLDTRGEAPFHVSRDPAVLLRAYTRQFAMLSDRGVPLLLLREEEGERVLRTQGWPLGEAPPIGASVTLRIAPSLRFTLAWTEEGKNCTIELVPRENGFRRDGATTCSEPEVVVAPPQPSRLQRLLQLWPF